MAYGAAMGAKLTVTAVSLRERRARGALAAIWLLAAAAAAGCAALGPREDAPAIAHADRDRLLDAAHHAFTEFFGGAIRDDAAGRLVYEGPEPWLTGFAIVHAEAQVTPADGAHRLTIRSRRRFREDEHRDRMGRFFTELEEGDGFGEDAPELSVRLMEAASRWLERSSSEASAPH
jgi:hypothetical protein